MQITRSTLKHVKQFPKGLIGMLGLCSDTIVVCTRLANPSIAHAARQLTDEVTSMLEQQQRATFLTLCCRVARVMKKTFRFGCVRNRFDMSDTQNLFPVPTRLLLACYLLRFMLFIYILHISTQARTKPGTHTQALVLSQHVETLTSTLLCSASAVKRDRECLAGCSDKEISANPCTVHLTALKVHYASHP